MRCSTGRHTHNVHKLTLIYARQVALLRHTAERNNCELGFISLHSQQLPAGLCVHVCCNNLFILKYKYNGTLMCYYMYTTEFQLTK